jgi:hypothetical protein
LGEWSYSSTHSLPSALDGGKWSASRRIRFTSKERAPGAYWIGGHSNIIFTPTPRYSEWSLPIRASTLSRVSISHVSHECCMSFQSHSPLFHHPNNIWRNVQIMKLLITQSSPASHHFLRLRSNYSHYPVLKHRQSMVFL